MARWSAERRPSVPVTAEKREADGKKVRRWAKNGEAKELAAAMEEDPTLCLNVADDNGYHALHWAVIKSHLPVVRVLIEGGAELEAEEHGDRCTPLLLAVRMEHTQVSAALIEARANVHAEDRYGHCMLRWGAKSNQHRTLQLLLDARARNSSSGLGDDEIRLSVRERDGDVNEALRLALRGGYAEAVRAPSQLQA